MFRRLDRYVIKEMFVPVLTGTAVIAGLFAANELIFIFKTLNVQSIPVAAIAQLVILRMPRWLVLTLPAGMAIGTALAIGRLARESEITAMRASGIPIRRLLIPVALIGLLLSVLNFFMVEKVVPASAERYLKLARGLIPLAYQPTFKPNVNLTLGRYQVRFGNIQRNDDGSLALRDVFLFEVLSPGEIAIYQAKTGSYREGVWKFPKSYFRYIKDIGVFQVKSKDVVINEPIQINDLFVNPEASEQTVDQVKASIATAEKAGMVPHKLIVDLHSKYSVPASCIIFAITSALAAVRFARTGPFIGLMVSLILVGMYYNLYVICTDILGKGAYINPIFAAWLPNLIYVGLAAIIAWRLE